MSAFFDLNQNGSAMSGKEVWEKYVVLSLLNNSGDLSFEPFQGLHALKLGLEIWPEGLRDLFVMQGKISPQQAVSH